MVLTNPFHVGPRRLAASNLAFLMNNAPDMVQSFPSHPQNLRIGGPDFVGGRVMLFSPQSSGERRGNSEVSRGPNKGRLREDGGKDEGQGRPGGLGMVGAFEHGAMVPSSPWLDCQGVRRAFLRFLCVLFFAARGRCS